MTMKTTNNSKLIIATTIVAFFAISTSLQSVEALANHATHTMNSQGGAYPDIWGIKSTYIADNTSISSGTLTSPTWATLDTGIYREVGWLDNSGGSFYSYWAINGAVKTPTYTGISDGTSYNWEVSNINQDFTWEMSAPGLTKTWTDFSYGDPAVDIQNGLEYSTTSITLPTITYSSQKAYVNGGWANWSDFVNGRVGETDPADAYVLECGNDYTSQHGEGSEPASC